MRALGVRGGHGGGREVTMSKGRARTEREQREDVRMESNEDELRLKLALYALPLLGNTSLLTKHPRTHCLLSITHQ